MRHIKRYGELFEGEVNNALSQDQIDFLNRFVKGTWRVNPSTGLVDIQGDFKLEKYKSDSFMGIRFGVVDGDFDFSRNNVTSLKGSPLHVKGDFIFELSGIESLEGSPKKVDGTFECSYNPLKSLEGAPDELYDFYCSHTLIKTLEGAPKKVGGTFYCAYNDQLESLKGAPELVVNDFYCNETAITSLEGGPKMVGGAFNCSNNKLRDLKGAPISVGDDFRCTGKWLVSLEGMPENIYGHVFLPDCPPFLGTPEGRIEAMFSDRIMYNRISPIVKFDEIVEEVAKTPTLLVGIERLDKELYDRVLKTLGWDKMGPDLLRQLKDGIL